VTRKILIIVAALIIPGGLIALVGAWVIKLFGQSERGRQMIALAHKRVPSFASVFRMPLRQAA